MRHDELGDAYCSVARTWSVLGERWTMLILRECFRGQRRYDQFRERLGLGSNVLNDRLRVLVAEEILERVPYEQHPPRFEYRVTPKGEDLFPVMVAVMNWGDKYKNDVPPVRLRHDGCGHEAEPRMVCRHCGEPIDWRGTSAEFRPGAW